MGCISFSRGIFLTQVLSPPLLPWQKGSSLLSPLFCSHCQPSIPRPCAPCLPSALQLECPISPDVAALQQVGSGCLGRALCFWVSLLPASTSFPHRLGVSLGSSSGSSSLAVQACCCTSRPFSVRPPSVSMEALLRSRLPWGPLRVTAWPFEGPRAQGLVG